MKGKSLLELLDIYMNLSDKQNEMIIMLTKVIKEQRYEIEQLKGEDASETFEKDIGLSEDLIAEYNNL